MSTETSKPAPFTKRQPAEPQSVLSRLQRTASTLTSQGLSYFNQPRKNTTDGTASPQPKTPKLDGCDTTSTTPKPEDGADKSAVPTAFERFMGLGKTRKDWEVEWPPSHWAENREGKQAVLGTVHAEDVPTAAADSDIETTTKPPENDSTPDAATLAQRIQRLLSSNPPDFPLPAPEPAAHTADPVPGTLADEALHSEPVQRRPLEPPPRHPALASDPKLVSLLSSPSVMNGDDKRKGKGTEVGQSVWDALEHLKAQIPWPVQKRQHGQSVVDKGKAKDTTPVSGQQEEDGEDSGREEDVLDDDDSGVMVYGPLFPSSDPVAAASDVELAKSEFVSAPEHHRLHKHDDGQNDQPPTASQPTTPQPDKLELLRSKVEGMWPFAKGAGENAEASNGEPTLSTTRVHFTPVTAQAKQRRVWVPSPDKISVQVMWWGYRIYLPPPVLEALDSSQLETAKRAALLTTALKYALDRVPLAIVPPPAQPAMRLCKAFTPYVGYVGSFVAWSWAAVKGFDKGHGVTLSATWLLSIAVVPGTWEPPQGEGIVEGGKHGSIDDKQKRTDEAKK
ncbi:hypothetical protein BDW22DRAFT_1423948 [Trametopsis cervina]|nr:hypothetical protein BDW22DRAFT_1423948 [Trametopsis cervina]